jgi:hypothetical protein
MSLFSRKGQDVPVEFVGDPAEAPRVQAVVKSLEANRKAVVRWFWYALFALNLVLWSFTLCAAFLLRSR